MVLIVEDGEVLAISRKVWRKSFASKRVDNGIGREGGRLCDMVNTQRLVERELVPSVLRPL